MPLKYDLEGSGCGPAVVLLHSSVCDRRMWQPQWAPLIDAGHRVLRLDFRGFGETPAPAWPYNNAADVLELLDAVGIERVSLVGASFGGRVAQEFAARWPDRVDRLVLLCAARAGHPPTAAIKAFGEREDELLAAGDLAAATELNLETFLGPRADEATRELVRRMQRHAFEVQIAAPEVARVDVAYDIAAITAPALVVSGALDVDYFREIALELAATIPGARHVELDWAGHLPSLEDPASLNPLLLGALTPSATF
jgi:pimeloyl-ACP methyl ester carboxylesterase